ncbi:hypothetical protein [Vibrio fluvialis]|uniref:hypothetical protein n=1 Tax=Vibrio fluvialis TaxID=676 RepID=UPI00238008B4|nr:hypothetical protein [Vibrio fluvialis]WDY55295.1 hypothetical protein PUN47_18240 [Vibrio fluvialis]
MKIIFASLLMLATSQANATAQPDDERLIAALIERGVICQGLTAEQQQQALNIYLNKKHNKKNLNNKDTGSSSNPNPTEHCISPVSE